MSDSGASDSTSRASDYLTSFNSLPGRRGPGRPRTGRPRTALTTLGGLEAQNIICAVSESRGVSPTVGLAFVNLDTCEVVLSEICDSQTYVRTLQKIYVFAPSELLMVPAAARPPSTLYSIVQEALTDLDCPLTLLDRGYWNEMEGSQYIRDLAIADDAEAIEAAIAGKYFALCCLSASLKYVERHLAKSFAYHSLRINYQPSEGSMMIDISTIYSLELIQNLENSKSRQCLFGLLNETHTPMGARLLRSNILQPLTNVETLALRQSALNEMTTHETMFNTVRQVTKDFIDVDRLLTSLVVMEREVSLPVIEQQVNKAIMLRHFLSTIGPIYEALEEAESELLISIREQCAPSNTRPVMALIQQTINDDVKYSKSPLDLRNQRTYAVKAGVNGLLDVSRQTFKENTEDIFSYVEELRGTLNIDLQLKFDSSRQYYLRIDANEMPLEGPPAELINIVTNKNKSKIECSTLELAKRNLRVTDSHNECLLLSDKMISQLLDDVRNHAAVLLKVSESIAMLDMITAFAEVVTSCGYVRPSFDDTLAVRAARHPIKDRYQQTKFVPNDIHARRESRFQIITGCNMSGKSTFIRTVAIFAVMAQIGCFVPAEVAYLPIRHQLFARVSVDDNIQANVSTFASEMREMAFILRNVDESSLIIIDELGRGTSSRDGLAIAIAIAEALVDSHALVWFTTHFSELCKILAEREGVVNLHLAVDMPDASKMHMLYKVSEGPEQQIHYGIALAKTLPLPSDVLANAETVAAHLQRRADAQKNQSPAVIVHRRRRLMLKLREELIRARESDMADNLLRDYLQALRSQFMDAMEAIEGEAEQARRELDGEEDAEPGSAFVDEQEDDVSLLPDDMSFNSSALLD